MTNGQFWSWLPTSLQDAFAATFCDGHSNPNRRASLNQLESALRDTVRFMQRESKARELMPKKKHMWYAQKNRLLPELSG